MKLISTLAAGFALCCAAEALAATSEDELAICAWDRVPQTARKLLKTGGDFGIRNPKEYRVPGLFHKIWASCLDKRPASLEGHQAQWNGALFFELLSKRKPKNVGLDKMAANVKYCEFRFPDQPSTFGAAALSWTYKDGNSEKDIEYSRFLLWRDMPTLGQVRLDVFGNVKGVPSGDPVEAISFHEGMNSGQLFVLKKGMGISACKIVSEDGRLVDA